jgi:hypothetical protein
LRTSGGAARAQSFRSSGAVWAPGGSLRNGEGVRMTIGSCLCGSVAFEVSGMLTEIEYCHCPKCKKAYGSALRRNAAHDRLWADSAAVETPGFGRSRVGSCSKSARVASSRTIPVCCLSRRSGPSSRRAREAGRGRSGRAWRASCRCPGIRPLSRNCRRKSLLSLCE